MCKTILRDEGWRPEIAADPGRAIRNGLNVVIGGRCVQPDRLARAELYRATQVQRAGAVLAVAGLRSTAVRIREILVEIIR